MQNKADKINSSAMLNVDLIENEFQLNPEQQKEIASFYEGIDKFQVGQIVSGNILDNTEHGILVDIHYKSDGLIPLYEFSSIERKQMAKGNQIEVVIDRLEDEEGSVVLSYQKAKSIKAWDRISDLAQKEEPVRGIVTHKVKGGLSVDIGVPAFLPGSQVDVQRVTDFDQFVGEEVICTILKINKKRGNIIISRRKHIEEERKESRQQALETIQENQVVQGIVKNITNYGVFVDIGGIDGLLHITDMSWGRINHPSELVKIGDNITVKILSFDKEREKISLGMKQLAENPWDNIEDKYSVNNTIKGRISSITDYGLFIEVEKGIEGLVHISEISWTNRISNLSKHFEVNENIEAVIVALDTENRRMSLSVKQLKTDPWKQVAQTINVGDILSGKISNITDFGLFVQIDEGIDGLVHISDLSWTDHISHPSEIYKKGDSVKAIVLAINPESRKISLGIKQLSSDPWENIEEDYPAGTTVEGTISKITNFGAFVKLPNGIEGLVHISEVTNNKDKESEKIEDILKINEKMTFKVIKVNKEDRKLGLSLKALSKTPTTPQETIKPKPQERKAPKFRPNRKVFVSKVKDTTRSKTLNSPLQQALAEHAAKLNNLQDIKKKLIEQETLENEIAVGEDKTNLTAKQTKKAIKPEQEETSPAKKEKK
jgi:small subunit ribosomal protein S1